MSSASSSTPTRLTMPGQVHKAYKVMLKLLHPKLVSKDQQIPLRILKKAKGVAFVTVVKAGFIWSGTLGSGIVIARLPDGTWSGPSSLGVVGMGWGGLIGASVTDSVIILNTDLAVKAFAGHGQIKFGGNLSVSAGPLGREADGSAYAGDGGVAACYSYSHSRGLFAGISLQGAVFVTRDSDNAKFYGTPAKASDILKGRVPPPQNQDLENLVALLNTVREDGVAGSSMSSASSSSAMPQFGSMSLHDADDEDGDDYAEQIQLEALGWSKIMDPTGKPYFWHAEQNKTQWDNPLLTAAPPVAPPPAIAEPTRFVPPPPPAATQNQQLPPGWTSVPTGDGLGTVYYWHQERNVTQWERPANAAPAPVSSGPVRPVSLPRQSSMVKQYAPQTSTNSSFGEVRQQPQLQQQQQQQQPRPVAASAPPLQQAQAQAAPALKPRPVIPPRPGSTTAANKTTQNPFQ